MSGSDPYVLFKDAHGHQEVQTEHVWNRESHSWNSEFSLQLPAGSGVDITAEVWDYEIRHVNTLATEYNNLSHSASKENKWQKEEVTSK